MFCICLEFKTQLKLIPSLAYVIYPYHIAVEKQPSRSNKPPTNMHIGMLL